METLVNKASTARFIRKMGLKPSAEVLRAVDESVERIVLNACDSAKKQNRKVVKREHTQPLFPA